MPAEGRNSQRLVVQNIGGIIELKISPKSGQIGERGQQRNDANEGPVSEPVRFFQELFRDDRLSEGSNRLTLLIFQYSRLSRCCAWRYAQPCAKSAAEKYKIRQKKAAQRAAF